MKKILLSIIIFFLFLPSSHSLDSFEIYEALNNSTVRINIWQNYENESTAETITGGTGIVINKINNTYYILTNAHVVLEEYCFGEEDCQDLEYDDSISIVIDHPDSEYEHSIDYDAYVWWVDYDLAIIRLELEDEEVFYPIEIGGNWHPLMNVYGAGYPSILGNYYKDYSDMVYCGGLVNAMFSDDEALDQLGNYSIAHSCTLAGGMSGGPLVDSDGMLLGINGLSGGTELYTDGDGNLEDIDIAAARFDYAIDIWNLYALEIIGIEEEEGHFNPNSQFHNYLPKLSSDYHSDFYESYVEYYPDQIDRINQLFK